MLLWFFCVCSDCLYIAIEYIAAAFGYKMENHFQFVVKCDKYFAVGINIYYVQFVFFRLFVYI